MTHKFQSLMRTYMMLLTALLCLGALVACGDSNGGDDNGGSGSGNGGSQAANTNGNSTADGTDRAVLRTEFPNIESKRDDYYIIVHRLSGAQNQYTYASSKYTFDSDGVNFCVVWDKNRKSQLCTCYQMHRGYNGEYNRVMGLQYPQDPDLPTQYRLDRDYISGSGFQHGHICPNVDRTFSHDANAQTNYMTNMQPQYAQFNGYDSKDNSHTGLWLKMENKVTGLAKNLAATDTLFICKGGTIQDGQVLRKISDKMIVPKYFFMAVLKKSSTGYHAFGFWTEHLSSYVPQNVDLKQYAMSIDELEKLTGIDFFCNLPDKVEDEVEKTFSPSYFGF